MTIPTLAADLQKVRNDVAEAGEALRTWVSLREEPDDLETEDTLYDAIEALTRAVSTLALAVEREAQQP